MVNVARKYSIGHCLAKKLVDKWVSMLVTALTTGVNIGEMVNYLPTYDIIIPDKLHVIYDATSVGITYNIMNSNRSRPVTCGMRICNINGEISITGVTRFIKIVSYAFKSNVKGRTRCIYTQN